MRRTKTCGLLILCDLRGVLRLEFFPKSFPAVQQTDSKKSAGEEQCLDFAGDAHGKGFEASASSLRTRETLS